MTRQSFLKTAILAAVMLTHPRLLHSRTADNPNRATATIAGVKIKSVEWKVMLDAGKKPISPLKPNDNPGNGVAIFPGQVPPSSPPHNRQVQDTVRRNRVRVEAQVTPPLPNLKVLFRSFDVDDPSANTAPVDPNGSKGNDNFGGPKTGNLVGESTVNKPLAIVSAETDEHGKASVEFQTTYQPGDNFRVGACLSIGPLESLSVETDPKFATYMPPGSAQPEKLTRFGGLATEMLTVWRHLWVDFDSMGPPPDTGPQTNFDTHKITKVQVLPGTANPTLIKLFLDGHLTDRQANRFENGIVGVTGAGVARIHSANDIKYPIVSSANKDIDWVIVEKADGLTEFLKNAVGKTCVIYDDDDQPVGGRPPRDLPYYTLSGGNLIESAFKEAYIEPVNLAKKFPAYIDRNIAFLRNIPNEDTGSKEAKMTQRSGWNLESTATFWTVHLVASWQGEITGDLDPEYIPAKKKNEGIVEKIDKGASDVENNLSIIFIETIREIDFPDRKVEIHAVVHEIGHAGGYEDDKAKEDHKYGSEAQGIMAHGAPWWNDKFSAKMIRKFREDSQY